MIDDTYICGLCGRLKRKGRPDAEARAEYEDHFPEHVGTPEATVCDDCFHWVYDPEARRVRTENFGTRPPWAVP